jgi:hypothetical protein
VIAPSGGNLGYNKKTQRKGEAVKDVFTFFMEFIARIARYNGPSLGNRVSFNDRFDLG